MPPTKPQTRRYQQGFTLMEVLIAVTITAVIGLGVWQVLNGVISSRDRVNEVSAEFDQLLRTFLLMERDLGQVVNRPARNIYGDFEPAFTSQSEEFELQLTRQGWRNPLGIRRSELQRVAWEYTGSELRRRYWESVDQGQEDNSHDQLMISGINSFSIRFMNDDRAWVDQWPSDEAMASIGTTVSPTVPLPLGVEITLEHERFGELSRIYALPQFDPATAQGIVNQANDQEPGGQSDTDDTEESDPDATGATPADNQDAGVNPQ